VDEYRVVRMKDRPASGAVKESWGEPIDKLRHVPAAIPNLPWGNPHRGNGRLLAFLLF